MSGPVAIEVEGASKRFGSLEVLHRVDLTVPPASIVALLGPSGCGKTTLLRTIAGLERPDAGEVHIGDRVVAGPSVHVPPERRRVGMVFQDWALFPHLTVAQNVGYGLPRGQRTGPRVDEALAMVGLAGLGDRSPTTLSGGQQQRVALARALAPQPGVLLLDEPFSNLDSALRAQVRTEVHELLAELRVTTVFVTHDQEEAFVLGDEVAVMSGGHIVQQATPTELYERPASPWVATFVGDGNLVRGEARGSVARTPVGAVPVAGPVDGAVHVVLRPEELHVGLARGAGASGAGASAAAAGVQATVELAEYYGHDTVYVVRPDGGDTVRARVASGPRFRRGDHVVVSYAGPPAVVYPATPGGSEHAAGRRPGADGAGEQEGLPADEPAVEQLPTT